MVFSAPSSLSLFRSHGEREKLQKKRNAKQNERTFHFAFHVCDLICHKWLMWLSQIDVVIHFRCLSHSLACSLVHFVSFAKQKSAYKMEQSWNLKLDILNHHQYRISFIRLLKNDREIIFLFYSPLICEHGSQNKQMKRGTKLRLQFILGQFPWFVMFGNQRRKILHIELECSHTNKWNEKTEERRTRRECVERIGCSVFIQFNEKLANFTNFLAPSTRLKGLFNLLD